MTKQEILIKLYNKRQKTTIYTRVMGYHRPVESFNISKRGEHQERILYKERK